MTTPKSGYRARRKTTASMVPKNIAQWFAGERRFTFYAFVHPHCMHLEKYWATWLADHPGAIMPPGLECLLRR